MGVGGQWHMPAALPLGNTRYLLCRRLGGPQGRSGLVQKILPYSWTIQPVAGHYANCAIPAHVCIYINITTYYRNFGNCLLLSEWIHSHSCTLWKLHNPSNAAKMEASPVVSRVCTANGNPYGWMYWYRKNCKLTVSKCNIIVLDNGLCWCMLLCYISGHHCVNMVMDRLGCEAS